MTTFGDTSILTFRHHISSMSYVELQEARAQITREMQDTLSHMSTYELYLAKSGESEEFWRVYIAYTWRYAKLLNFLVELTSFIERKLRDISLMRSLATPTE